MGFGKGLGNEKNMMGIYWKRPWKILTKCGKYSGNFLPADKFSGN